MFELDELIKLHENGAIDFGEKEVLINMLIADNRRLQDFQDIATEIYPSLELEITAKKMSGKTLDILRAIPKKRVS